MPFSSWKPEDLVRAEAALERAWTLVVAKGLARNSDLVDHDRMARIIAGLVGEASSEDDLVSLAVQGFVSTITI